MSENYVNPRNVDILDLLKVIWQGKWLIAALVVAAMAVTFLVGSFVTPPIYQDRAVVQLTAGQNGRLVTVGRLIRNEEFLGAILPKVQGFSDDEVLKAAENLEANTVISYDTIVGSSRVVVFDVIELTIRGNNPKLIHALISAVVDELQQRSDSHYQERVTIRNQYLNSLRSEIALLDEMIAKSRETIDSQSEDSELLYSLVTRLDMQLERREKAVADEYETALEALEDQPFAILTPPVLPSRPINIKMKVNLALALFLGLFAGVVLVILRDYVQALKTRKSRA